MNVVNKSKDKPVDASQITKMVLAKSFEPFNELLVQSQNERSHEYAEPFARQILEHMTAVIISRPTDRATYQMHKACLFAAVDELSREATERYNSHYWVAGICKAAKEAIVLL